ncbi:MAG TPA: methyltransferase domain-containing protein [Polyangiaceae bacterium]|nr:methyltransferase domain-containing protein [Polyangiaceae bacterium]
MGRQMDASGSRDDNRAYYDAFSAEYERERGQNDPGGYHELLDELEAGYVKRFGAERDVLEVGCGTGLVLLRIRDFARRASGVDLSPGMLEKAKLRGLDVTLGSATELPFGNDQFDVTCSFKVLAHVPEIEKALAEMARVTRPGGMVLAEFYNPYSLRGLVKRLGPAGKIAEGKNERDVYTRFDSPARAKQLTPPGCVFAGARGVRITIPSAKLMRPRFARRLFRAAEHLLCDSPLARLAGFYVAAYEKRG